MATAKRKQEELGEECDEQESHEADQCSDDDEAKRPRLEALHLHMPHHRQWSDPSAEVPPDPTHRATPTLGHGHPHKDIDSAKQSEYYYYNDYINKDPNDAPFDLSNWHRVNRFDARDRYEVRETKASDSDDLNVNDSEESQPINFAYYHF